WLGRSILGEELEHLVVEAEFALGDGQSHGCGCEALAQRVEYVRSAGIIGPPPTLGDHAAVADQHETVHRVDLLVGCLNEGEDVRRRYALGLGRAARESLRWRR